jgi:hypothetical protein
MESKTIAIKDLPDGYFKEQLTKFANEEAEVNVVVVMGFADDWAAYIGWPSFDQIKPEHKDNDSIQYYCRAVRAAQHVADHGDKLSKREACAIFPAMNPERYRE